MAKKPTVSDPETIKLALYQESKSTFVATDADVKKFQECQASGFSFDSAIGLFFLAKKLEQDKAARGAER